MIGYKVAKNGGDTRVVITLEIPEDALTNMERSTIRVKDTAKYRTNKAIVVKIEDQKGNKYTSAKSFVHKDKSLTYTLGETLIIEDYDSDIEKVCSSGIHFFLNKHVAEVYELNKNDIENGLYQLWYDNGEKHIECIFKDKKLDGFYLACYENGQKAVECTYKDGEKDGFNQVWHENSQKSLECTYKDGIRVGFSQSWHENGQKCEECAYKDWKIDGFYQSWYDNGQKSSECTYKYGIIDGLYRSWHENGQKWVECTYKDGEQVNN
jgi:antitoxin component YwqK of YwqJK toxin-antitoxin module